MLLVVFCLMSVFNMRFIDWFFFFFKQKTAYEMRISDWSSDVCSSDLQAAGDGLCLHGRRAGRPSGREEDQGPRQAPDGEDPARILPQRAVEGDPARDGQRGRGRRRRERKSVV